ncbi:MAG: diguanylate cyclase [Micrococcales bacterium]|nr:diguanylate cyclase [Micrococcales bacterium]MCL2666120.1 diguanylate cyclase [Micrococcales bacterium]
MSAVPQALAVVAAVAALGVLVATVRRLPRLLAVPVAVFTLAAAGWALAVALVPDQLVMYVAQTLLGWCAISVLVWLALQVSRWTHLATRRLLVVGWLPPLVTVTALVVPATRRFVVDETETGSVTDSPLFVVTSSVGVLVVVVALAVLLVVGSASTPAQRRLLLWVVASFMPAGVAWMSYALGHGSAVWTPTLLCATMTTWLLLGAQHPGLVQLPITVPQVLAGIGEGVVVLTGSGEVLLANVAAWEMLATGLRQWKTYADARLGPVPEPDTATEVRTASGRVVELMANRLDQPGRAPTVVVTARDITELAQASVHLQDVASRDAMTGARNRRFLESRLPELVEQARGRFPLSLMMLDVDRFKHVNDTYGHAMGDRVIVAVADEACASLPAGAELVRMGGDEFAVMLPGMDRTAASKAAELTAARCAELQFATRSAPLSVTVSVGVHELTGSMDAAGLLDAADQALYVVKRANKASFAVPHQPPPPGDSRPIPVVPWIPPAPGSPEQVPGFGKINESRRDRRYRDHGR